MRIGIGDWGLEIGNGDSDGELGLGIGFRIWDWGSGLKFGIGD